MLQRTLLVLVALSLPLWAGGVDLRVEADGGGIDPSTDPDFSGLPDLQATSGRFLVLSGSANASLNGEQGGDGRTVLRLSFDSGDDVRILVFDADTAGNWDQRVDGEFVVNGYGALYHLFPDPDGDVARSLIDDIAPMLPPEAARITADLDMVSGTSFPPRASDEEWCTLFDGPGEAAALGADGRYHYTLEAFLLDAEGFELTGFKVAFNGTYLLPAGASLGFVGGVVDARTPAGMERPVSCDPPPDLLPTILPDIALCGDPGPIVPGTNTFAGTFRFPFNPCRVCDDLVIMEADADWNAPITNLDLMPTGNPPDDGGRYFVSGVGIRDASDFQIPLPAADVTAGHFGVMWEIQNPMGTPSYDSLLAPLTHPSETAPAVGDPFQSTVLMGSLPILQGNPGIWTLEWRGVDARNSIFIRAGGTDFGTTPCPCNGRLFCDDNGNGTYDQGEMVLPGETVQVTPVDAMGNARGATLVTTSDANGLWSVDLDTSGLIQVDVVPPPFPGLTGGLTLPLTFDSCQQGAASKQIPFSCTGSIWGRIIKELRPANCMFDMGETPLADVPVTLQEVDAAGNDIGPPVMTMTDGNGDYHFEDLTAGTYRITNGGFPGLVMSPCGQSMLLVNLMPGDMSMDNDFFFLGGQITVQVFREPLGANCNNEFDLGETPLQGVTVMLENLSGGAVVPPTMVTDANGQVTWDCLFAGTYRVTVDGMSTPEISILVPSVPAAETVTFDLNAGEELSVPSGWCPNTCTLQGTVCIENGTCDGICDTSDTGVAGVTVELTPVSPPGPVLTTMTNALGQYMFADIAPGTYVVSVPGGQPQLVGTTPSSPTSVDFTCPDTGGMFTIDFANCPNTCDLTGTVCIENGTCDGVCDASDTGVAGVTVTLTPINPPGAVQMTVTDANGMYSFPGLAQGTYTVAVPGGQPQLVGTTPSSPTSVNFTCPDTGGMFTIDFANCPNTCDLTGKVCIESGTCDGICDANDPGVAGVTVTLTPINPPGPAVMTLTDAAGLYSFPGLTQGTYTVSVAGGQPQLVGTTPSSPTSVNFT
ncbi:MAG: SdrD B-like domain-containing protein, partial [Planctomycetota bacterium]